MIFMESMRIPINNKIRRDLGGAAGLPLVKFGWEAMNVKRYIGRRLFQLFLILIGVTFLVFLLMYLSPGDPAQRKLTAGGVAVTEEVLERAREDMGLNRPLLAQYGSWLGRVVRGDFGESLNDGLPVAGKLAKGLKNTLLLSLTSLFAALLFAIPLGTYSAVRQHGAADKIISFLTFMGNSLPNFLIAVLLMYFLCLKTKLFPILANGSAKGLFLPALTLAIPLFSQFTRQVRAAVLEQLHKPYVAGARSRGVKESAVLVRNVLRNSLISIITVVGMAGGTLMAGSVVVESIFLWPGIGKLMMDVITAKDYPVVQGLVLVMALLFVTVNLVTDLLYHKLDPRIWDQGEETS